MTSKYLWLALLVPLALLAGCTAPEQQEMKDCGKDMECFANASLTCMPAKVTFSQSSGGLSMGLYMELRGFDYQSNCKIYYKFLGYETTLDQYKQQVAQVNGIMRDKEMECAIPLNSSDFSSSGSDMMSSITKINKYCKGSMVDLMNQAGSAIGTTSGPYGGTTGVSAGSGGYAPAGTGSTGGGYEPADTTSTGSEGTSGSYDAADHEDTGYTPESLCHSAAAYCTYASESGVEYDCAGSCEALCTDTAAQYLNACKAGNADAIPSE